LERHVAGASQFPPLDISDARAVISRYNWGTENVELKVNGKFVEAVVTRERLYYPHSAPSFRSLAG